MLWKRAIVFSAFLAIFGAGPAGIAAADAVAAADGGDAVERLIERAQDDQQAARRLLAKARLTRLGLTQLAAAVESGQGDALDALHRAAEGDAGARHDLGMMYLKGQGVAADSAQAARLFRSAAEAGHAPSQYNLGLLYLLGEGVPPDPAQAVKWLTLAAADGDQAMRLRVEARMRQLSRTIGKEPLADGKEAARQWMRTHGRARSPEVIGGEDGLNRMPRTKP